MHKQASDYVYEEFHLWRKDKTNFDIVEIGSLDINGSVRTFLSPFAKTYRGIDMQEVKGVDEVADAS